MLGGMNSANSVKVEKVVNMRFKGEGYYTGDTIIKNGKHIKHGKGKIRYRHGNSYDGDWKNDQENGNGIYTYDDGDTYEGEFANGMFEGYGVYKSNNPPHTYRGDYVNDKKHGTGFLTTTCPFAHGTVFGDFANDNLVNGTGKRCIDHTKIFENGDYENGELVKGIRIWPEGHRFEGIYDKKGNLAKGTFEWADGSKYEGEYENGRRSGFGVSISSDGYVYEGYYKNDKQNGMGKITFPDGTVISGEFHDNWLKHSVHDRARSSIYDELGPAGKVFSKTRRSSKRGTSKDTSGK